MASESKEEKVLKLILENSPLKEWHFEEIVRKSDTTKASANKWLRKYVKQGLLLKVKKKGKFPFFTAGPSNHRYNSQKRIYMLEKIHQSGLLQDLLSLKNAKTIILFGSAVRGDWYKGSDIDIFIFGNKGNFDKGKYETKLGTYIELHVFNNQKEIKEVRTGLLTNVANGYVVKGQIQDIMEV